MIYIPLEMHTERCLQPFMDCDTLEEQPGCPTINKSLGAVGNTPTKTKIVDKMQDGQRSRVNEACFTETIDWQPKHTNPGSYVLFFDDLPIYDIDYDEEEHTDDGITELLGEPHKEKTKNLPPSSTDTQPEDRGFYYVDRNPWLFVHMTINNAFPSG
jgi:hypothetical protein